MSLNKVGNIQMEDRFAGKSELKDGFSFWLGQCEDHIEYLRREVQQALKLLKHWRHRRAADTE